MTSSPKTPDKGSQDPVSDGFDLDEFTRTHLTAVVALVIALFALVKCYAAAGYSLTTAGALLTASPGGVLLGALTRYAYELCALISAGAFCLVVLGRRRKGRVPDGRADGLARASPSRGPAGEDPAPPRPAPTQSSWPVTRVALAVLGLAMTAIAPLSNLLLTYGALALVVLLGLLVGRVRGTDGRRYVRPLVISFFVGASIYTVGASLPDLWVPVEVVELKANAESSRRLVLIGYVVRDDGGWMSVLRAGDRGVSRVPSDDVVTRRLCHYSGAQPRPHRPLYYSLTGRQYVSPNLNCRDTVK